MLAKGRALIHAKKHVKMGAVALAKTVAKRPVRVLAKHTVKLIALRVV